MESRALGIRSSALLGLLLASLLSVLLPGSVAQAAGTNDYPYKNQTNVTAADKWGFTQRQCVSFAAWRMAQARRPLSNAGNAWGHAYNWDTVASRKGKTVTTTPRAGAIAQWNGGEASDYWASNGAKGRITAGRYGHVAYVIKVISGNRVVIEQYNMSGNRSYSQMVVKAPRYLYL